jgi:hypothetical protein
MDQPSSSELDLIQDPETGLALLAKRSGEETPAQELQRLFWQAQFTHWREWRTGDVQAVAHAVICCAFYKRRPPLWLCHASLELCKQCRSDAEKRERSDLAKHFLRWKAVELVRGQRPGDPRNFKRGVRGDTVWEEAAKLVAGTAAEAVRKSHALIRRAGGRQVTLPNYRREIAVRERRRRKEKKLGRLLPSSLPRGRLLPSGLPRRIQKIHLSLRKLTEFSQWIRINPMDGMSALRAVICSSVPTLSARFSSIWACLRVPTLTT